MEDRNGPRFGYRCEEEHNQSLLLKLGMDVKGDQPDVHPIHFCHSCRPKATSIQRLSSILFFHSIGNHTCTPALIAQHAACFKSKKRGEIEERENKLWTATVTNPVTEDFVHMLRSHKGSSPLSPPFCHR